MQERVYQTRVIKKIRNMFPGCLIIKNDSGYMQGIPDWSIFYGRHWAMLEIKAHKNAEHQPNQDWYVDQLDTMSFAAFIFPENETEVLNGLRQALQPRRTSRVSQS